MPNSKNSPPGSINDAIRSRAVSRPFVCWYAKASSPPPWRMVYSWFRISPTRSFIRRVFVSNSLDLRFIWLLRMESGNVVRPLSQRHRGKGHGANNYTRYAVDYRCESSPFATFAVNSVDFPRG